MKKILSFIILLLAVLAGQQVSAQVFNPDDVLSRGPAPQQPPAGQVGKWVATRVVNWNSDAYKAYIYNGMPFRLMYPRNYKTDPADKKYPMIVFMHGFGERSLSLTDNERQLIHGGQAHMNAVNNGTFDGFLLYPQNQYGFWGGRYDEAIRDLVNIAKDQLRVDVNRVTVHGLSLGGQGTWGIINTFPQLFAAALPMSAISSNTAGIENIKYTPIWHFQGGLDGNPRVSWAQGNAQEMTDRNANYKLTIYWDLGHGVWNRAYAEPDFFPYINRANKTNPHVLTGKTAYCPGETILTRLGITAGFSAYEWRRNGQVIAGATGNELLVTQPGIYDVRFRRGSEWTYFSPAPVNVYYQDPTPATTITVEGSRILPSPEKNTVTLSAPEGFESYLWSNGATTRTITVSTQGNYTVTVTAPGGCFGIASAPVFVKVGNAAGIPAAPTNLFADVVSEVQVNLSWNDVANNELAYEVYASPAPNSGYRLVGLLPAGSTSFQHINLEENTQYYYIVRAINDNGSSANAQASARTLRDTVAPTAPTDLIITSKTRNTVNLSWQPSYDFVGVTQYEVYRNGQLLGTTTTTTFSAEGLVEFQNYTFIVRARDGAGNTSDFSNQVSTVTALEGLNYTYYEGNFTNLSQLATAEPVKRGIIANFDLTPRNVSTNFAFRFDGAIQIPTTGNYTFFTRSDDGSSLFISGNQVVFNDFDQGMTERSGNVYLTAGVYPISVLFRQRTSGFGLEVRWQGPDIAKQLIPNEVLKDNFTAPAKPSAPGNVEAVALSDKQIRVSWTDNSNDETHFEVFRSTSPTGPFTFAGSAPANTSSFVDGSLSAGTQYFYRVRSVSAQSESDFERKGLEYEYYEFVVPPNMPALPGNTNTPYFGTNQPVKTGRVNTLDIGVRNRNTNIAIAFRGYLDMPVAGRYDFWLTTDDGSRVYLNNTSLTNQDFINGNQRNNIAANRTMAAAGEYPLHVFYRNGTNANSLILRLEYQGPNGVIARQEIPASALRGIDAHATTAQAPTTAPDAPANLVASAITPSSITLQWDDNSTNEERFDIFRSANGVNFTKIGSSVANANEYTDTDLQGNTQYIYRVVAVNSIGTSAHVQGSFTTANNAPVFASIPNHTAQDVAAYSIHLTASDADGDAISISGVQLPAFATLSDNGNGKAVIQLSASPKPVGNYTIIVAATDSRGASTQASFTLSVSNAQLPQLSVASANATVNEGEVATVNISFSNPADPSEVLVPTIESGPAFASLVNIGNGTATLRLAPGFSAQGTHIVRIAVRNQAGSTVYRDVNVTVNDVDRNFVLSFNFNSNATANLQAPAPWNNSQRGPANGWTFTNLRDQNGNITPVTIQLTSNFGGAFNAGTVTGNNSGIVPDNVLREYYWFGIFGAANTASLRIAGLNPNQAYNFKFIGSSSFRSGGVTNNGSTVYTIGSRSVSLNVDMNTSRLAEIRDVLPAGAGIVDVQLSKDPSNVEPSGGYINGIIIEAITDESVPNTPDNLKAVVQNNGSVRLTWTDLSDNESSFEVHRATNANGPYTLLNPDAANSNTESYVDDTVFGTTVYFYKVRAINSNGPSGFTNTANVVTPNIAPQITDIKDIWIRNNQMLTIDVEARDNPNDQVQMSISNLPSFATFTVVSNGIAVLAINPALTSIGSYRDITITASDDKGGVSTRTFNINVTDGRYATYHVNFNSAFPAGAPWNNFNSLALINVSASNLKDETGVASNIAVTMLDVMQANTGDDERYMGIIFGDNSSAIPDTPMRTFYFEGSTNQRRFRVSGLSPQKRYNFAFMSSFGGGGDYTTVFTINGIAQSINATGNYERFVRFNGLVPDASGNLVVFVNKGANALFAIMNALLIEEYDADNEPLTPTNLSAVATGRTQIRLNWNDISANETGFEVYRSTSQNGTYTLVATLPANSTSFVDNGLAQNTRYFYQVRSVNGGFASVFTNKVSAVTLQRMVFINFNHSNQNNMGAPWNNTNSSPNSGSVPRTLVSNLRDDTNTNTGMSLHLNTYWDGSNPFGTNTTNNSGVLPDNVMRTFYFLELGSKAQLRIAGLNNNLRYNFVFFAATTFRDNNGNTNYTINGRTVALNPQNNTSNTISINDVAPENGQVIIDIVGAPTVVYGYINALLIHEYDAGATGSLPVSRVEDDMASNDQAIVLPASLDASQIIAYPNPFSSEVNVSMALSKADKVTYTVLDGLGRTVWSKQVEHQAGSFTENLDMSVSGASLSTGMYFLRLDSEHHGRTTIKLLRQ
jgi:fibronectin type 3 domain-containing protein/predicted esterase